MLIDLTFDEIQNIIDNLGNTVDKMEETLENWKIADEFHPLKSEIKGLNELIFKLEDYNFQYLCELAKKDSLSEDVKT